MRNFILAAIVALVSIQAAAQDYKSIYEKYSDDDRVTGVYISPAMFKMIGKLPEVKVEDNDLDLAPMIKSMTGFYMLQTEDASIAEKISKEIGKVTSGKKYETLMEVKEKGQKVNIMSLGDEKFLKSLLLTVFNKDDGETVFIGIDGLMSRSDVEEAMSVASKELF